MYIKHKTNALKFTQQLIQNVDLFLGHINSLHPTVKFTMEQEKEGSLPFLNKFLTQGMEEKININVYRKTTHIDRYLQYSSHHPEHVKRGTATCLFH